jgi:hypothetical protein
MNSNKKECEMVLRMCGLILFQFPMGTYLLKMIMKCFYWYKPLSCKEVEFTMAHNSWLWIGCSSILFLFFILICHPIYFVHPLLFFIHVHVVKYSSTSWYIICQVSKNILLIFLQSIEYSRKDLVLVTCSCSLVHIHAPTLTI